MRSSPANSTHLARVLNVGLAVVVGVSIVGFAMGTRTARPPDLARWAGQPAPRDERAIPSQPYAELRLRRFGPNSEVTSDLARLRAGIPSPTDKVEKTAADRGEALSRRATRRAYDGAPPSIPHPIDEWGAAVCLECHLTGIRLEGKVAATIPHDPLTSCTQCHVTALTDSRAPAFLVPSQFVGLAGGGRGARAWTGAPPVVPHAIWMRQSCSSCHGVTGPVGLRTTHPERQSCTQCHVPAGASPPRR